MFTWWDRISKNCKVDRSLEMAKAQVSNLEVTIMSEIDRLREEHTVVRADLQRRVLCGGSANSTLMQLAKRLKTIEKKLNSKQQMYDNIKEETEHLQNMQITAEVNKAMMHSLSAQEKLQNQCALGDPDDVIDLVQEARDMSADVMGRYESSWHDSDRDPESPTGMKPVDYITSALFPMGELEGNAEFSQMEMRTRLNSLSVYGQIESCQMHQGGSRESTQSNEHAEQMSVEFPSAPSQLGPRTNKTKQPFQFI